MSAPSSDAPTTTAPRVRDFSQPAPAIDVAVVASPVFELLLTMFMYDGNPDPEAEVEVDGLEELVRRHASPALLSELDRFRSCGEVWLPLIGVALETGATTVEAFVASLLETDPIELRRKMMHNTVHSSGRQVDDSDVEAAARGDRVAMDRVLGEDKGGIRSLLAVDTDATNAYVAGIIERFHDEVFVHQPDHSAALQRDAADKRAMAGTMPPEQLVERATNGVTFGSQADLEGVVLIPSVVIRPWVVITDHGRRRVFCYPAAEEHLTADPDSPPSFLVDFYKALGDEKRLHILSVLADGPISLGELATRLDLAKSTVHHHLRILRSAGLVRVTVGDDKAYGLRPEALPHAGTLLQGFLSGRLASKKGDTP